MRALSSLFLAVLSLWRAEALPSGFQDEGFGAVSAPTGFIFVPKPGGGNMMIVTAKSGTVVLFPEPDISDDRITILDMAGAICTTGERGLQSVAVTPNFATDRYVYLFFAWPKYGSCAKEGDNGPVNRLARFKMMDDFSLDPASEETIFDTSSMARDVHNGGDMAFGKDGYLYVSLGDGGHKGEIIQRRDNFLGSIVRIDADGGIPPDNPFIATPESGYSSTRCYENGVVPPGFPDETYCEELYAYGMRNPFRFAMDPNTPDGVVRMFFNDVGGGSWEETNELVKGANYGWPIQEGPCRPNRDTECSVVRDLMDPVHWYGHPSEGAAAVGCAFVPNGVWPSEYDGAFLYADFVAGNIYVMEEDPSRYCRDCLPPVPGWTTEVFHESEWPVQLSFGPYLSGQALYYTTRASGMNNVRRIYFRGGDNLPPNAVLTASRTGGQAGVTVTFDGSQSTDPNFDVLTYEWDFGDGSSPITDGASTVSHQYMTEGEFVVSLKVTDQLGFSDTKFVGITVGTRPVVTITTPPEGTEFAVGDQFTLTGSAVDADGNPVPASSLSWEVRQHHNTHYHPFLDATPGNNIALQSAPPPEDFEASTNSHLEIILTATDTNGVQGTVSRTLMPKMVTLTYDTVPSGLEVILYDFTVTTPIDVVCWENQQLTVDAPDQSPWHWVSWSNNKDQSHILSVPAMQPQIARQDGSDYHFVATYGMETNPTSPSDEDTLTTTLPPVTNDSSAERHRMGWLSVLVATAVALGCMVPEAL